MCLDALRDDTADLRLRLADARSAAAQVPHRTRYLLIVTDFLERLPDMHDQLVEQVERELGAD